MTAATLTLTDFLLARIAEDEAAAREAGSGRWASWNRSWDTDAVRDIADDSATSGNPRLFAVPTEYDEHVARNSPARVLAECEAKRQIVKWHVPDRVLENWYWSQRKCAECGGLWHVFTPFAKPTDIGAEQGCRTLRAIALLYADHPDYNPEWRP